MGLKRCEARGRETKGRWRSEIGKGEKVRRSEKQKIGRFPVKSSLGEMSMAAFNKTSRDQRSAIADKIG